jgi:hypothetical protein
VFHLHGGFWLVRDVAEAKDFHQLELNWHFAPDLTVSTSGNTFIVAASPSPQAVTNQRRLVLVAPEDAGWACGLTPGLFSPTYGRKEPAPVVRFSANLKLPTEFATLIAPLFAASDKPGRFVTLGREERLKNKDSLHGFRYDEETKTHYVIFADEKKPWNLGEWSSDAGFLYYRLEHRRLAHLILCGASFAKWQSKEVLTHPVPLERFEWLRNGEMGQIFSSDETVVQSLSEGLLESFQTVF